MNYSPVVQDLANAINGNDGWLGRFNGAILSAKAASPDDYKDIHEKTALPDFLSFIDDFLRWVPNVNPDVKAMDDVMERLGKFYFVFDQEQVYKLQTPITPANAEGPLSWLSNWLATYALELGNFMDTPESLTRASLRSFYNRPDYHMEDYIQPRGGWKSYNQFFARNVKPGARKIDDIGNDSIIISPADSCFDGAWPVDDNGNVTLKEVPWNINSLLQHSHYRDEFKGGIFMHAFLSSNDYHRQHAPVAGTVVEAKNIAGQVYLEVKAKDGKVSPVRPLPRRGEKNVDVLDNEGYQWCQMRGLVVLQSRIGYVAVLPIGMAQISSVVITAEVGRYLHKGEEISYFQFGGSDIVVVFQKKSKVNITAELTTPRTHYNVGNKIAESHMEL
ncbi:hypothetical protein G3M48_007033 [Beauveria asiatica]|uniref:Phosphatidylserine decarboxylase n=1 Tax=Beauveria asiatica TaxID=1069075 RepID=A0AAW0RMY6_9HYPO